MLDRAFGSCRGRPVRRELVDVKSSPPLDQLPGDLGQLATDHQAVVYSYESLVLGVDRVEVRWIVVAEVHVDRDPVELTEPRHGGSLWWHAQCESGSTGGNVEVRTGLEHDSGTCALVGSTVAKFCLAGSSLHRGV
jgi:hypothetical protein